MREEARGLDLYVRPLITSIKFGVEVARRILMAHVRQSGLVLAVT